MEKELINNNEEFAPEQAKLASLGRIFFARVIDLVISLVPGIFLIFFYHAHDVRSAGIIVGTSFGILFVYFIILAYLCRGNTIGKLMLGLKLRHKDQTKPKFREVLGRELYHVFVPWFVQLILQIAVVALAYYKNPDGTNNYYTTLCLTLQNISTLFYALWFIYLGVTIRSQADHQSGVDYKYQLFCYFAGYAKVKVAPEKKLEHHVHLDDNMPGNFNVSEIDKMLEDKNDETE